MIVQFETAKLAKEIGFNLKSGAFYGKYHDNVGKLIDDDNYSENEYQLLQKRDYGIYAIKLRNWNDDMVMSEYDLFCPIKYSAPTQSELQTWLRDVKKLFIKVDIFTDDNDLVIYDYAITDLNNPFNNMYEEIFLVDFFSEELEYKTYEEALEAGLQKARKYIKNEES